MRRHFLLATDGSSYARKAVDYLVSLFPRGEGIEVTVISVAQPPPSYLLSPVPGMSEIERLDRLDKIQERNLKEAHQRVKETCSYLVDRGFSSSQVHSKVVMAKGDIAETLLWEAREGRYDALIVGRRGLGRLASAWLGSVSMRLVEYGKGVPVWVVEGQAWNQRLLVAVDLGEAGFRVVDHVAFVLAVASHLEAVLIHVIPSLLPSPVEEDLKEIEGVLLEREKEEAARFFREAQKIFQEEGLPTDRIRVKVKNSPLGVAATLIKEAREGDYGTVVVGRRGRGGFKELLLGSVSSKVLFNLHRRTIWVVG
jgi:nucleotide-binding universal stress UspA family protein